MNMKVDVHEPFGEHESCVRSYCRNFPAVFAKAKGSIVYAENGDGYVDFLCGAGALNYGHNNDTIKQAVLDYIDGDNLMMSLDLHSVAKRDFIEVFQRLVLQPRHLDYRIQFTSPTGTSVVESAVKLARKTTGRQNVVAFTNAFHGMSGISLGLTGNRHHRQAISHGAVSRMPYDGYLGDTDTVDVLHKMLDDPGSGIDMPAAIILETVQGEGGLNVASPHWLRKLRALTAAQGIVLIVDDVQAGCGRTGRFFSFERAGIRPDLVCLSKSIGGMGFPMALLLVRPELDQWQPGEDNGTFRGNNLAFVAATQAIRQYWDGRDFEVVLDAKERLVGDRIGALAGQYPDVIRAVRGLGMMQGLEFHCPDVAGEVMRECFANRLLVERCGPAAQVLKLMPALTIERTLLERGLDIIVDAVMQVAGRSTGGHGANGMGQVQGAAGMAA